MKIITARRISQVFFLALFLWLCAVSILGEGWWQWRGWPVNAFLQLDPLVAIATLATTGAIYRGLIWALVTVIATILLGRVFCGWFCPFGTLHQVLGYIGRRYMRVAARIRVNTYHPAQAIKYYILLFMLGAAAWNLWRPVSPLFRSTLQTGLLDPIPLMQRSVNLTFGTLADHAFRPAAAGQRHYEGALGIGAVFLAALLVNVLIPRFYCRFVCPLGALLGVLGRFALLRIGKTHARCSDCRLCHVDCEGACDPQGHVRPGECVLCFNCTDTCPDDTLRYATRTSAAGERPWPGMTRRSALVALGTGLAAAPLARLSALAGTNFVPGVLRPPGSQAEDEFLARCIKCGQCMKICPTNIIQPALLQGGVEALWTPVLNHRIGTSGCTPNCVACGHICPTAAIRPLTIDEKLGRGEFAADGPVRMGLAFVDRGRCLPWAMGTPCIVCQEVCPVAPKAITTSDVFEEVTGGRLHVSEARDGVIEVSGVAWLPGQWATGDFHLQGAGGQPRAIVESGERTLRLGAEGEAVRRDASPHPGQDEEGPRAGEDVRIVVRLQRPVVSPALCTGCGICEHECPVRGLRAIRVTAENESRHPEHGVLVSGKKG
ncbi:MAG: 4Fe-4S binding protein [Lentisphaerae bacterium]|nr:4Fe-4S binding protein [Lentisphaerota bacterium]